MKREEFKELTGEDPVDVLGQDWENLIEEYMEAKTNYNDVLEAEATGN